MKSGHRVAGFSKVAVISVSEDRLEKIGKAVVRSLGSDVAAKVGFYLPDQFIAELKALPMPEQAPKTVRGYKIKRSAATVTPEEQKQREEVAIHLIAESMKKKT